MTDTDVGIFRIWGWKKFSCNKPNKGEVSIMFALYYGA
ncbi:hypothetical protein CZ765_08830 [Corynebacterium casei]|nr:hypothetical protein CZ765_08830 [Corynebacterium casei]